MWIAAVERLAGANLGDLAFQRGRLRRTLNGGNRFSATAAALDDAAAYLDTAAVAIALIEAEEQDDPGALRFRGKVDDPLEDGPDAVSFTAADLPWLERRRIQAEPAASRTFVQRDAGDEIVRELVNAQNARGTTRVRMGPVQRSVRRDRTYEPGKVFGDALAELARADDGFHYLANPVDGVPGTHAELVIRWPLSGVDRPGAKFEYGAGTIGNLSGYRRVRSRPRNFVTAVGAGRPDPLRRSKSDAASIATYDLLEDEVSHSTVTQAATLDAHAQGAVQPQPGDVFTFQPIAADPDDANAPYVPRLYHDFDVGDTGRLTIKRGRVQVSELVIRFVDAELEIEHPRATARLASLVVEVVGTVAGARHPDELLFTLLREHARRLRDLENRAT